MSKPPIQVVTATTSQMAGARQVAAHRDPRARGRDADGQAEEEVAQPGEALGEGIAEHQAEHDGRQRKAQPAQAGGGGDEGRGADRGEKRGRDSTDTLPVGSSRPEVRGFLASRRRSTMRLKPMAAVRAPAMATRIATTCASGDAVSARGHAPPRPGRRAGRRPCG